jgi:hypothetical protein
MYAFVSNCNGDKWFSFFEVKLKLIIQAHIAGNGISRVLIFKIFREHTGFWYLYERAHEDTSFGMLISTLIMCNKSSNINNAYEHTGRFLNIYHRAHEHTGFPYIYESANEDTGFGMLISTLVMDHKSSNILMSILNFEIYMSVFMSILDFGTYLSVSMRTLDLHGILISTLVIYHINPVICL